jgi:hypothetical protein
MSRPNEPVAVLRNQVERQEQTWAVAVEELGRAARRSVAPGRWIRDRPLIAISGALVVGLLLGRQGNKRRHRDEWRFE